VPDRDLEHLLSIAIRDLPDELAPETLLPRVLAAAAAWQRRPWYARPAVTWSPVHQVSVATASLILLVVVLVYGAPAGLSYVASRLLTMQTSWGTAIADGAQDVGTTSTTIAAVAGVVATLWRDYCAPLALYASAVIVLLAGALMTFTTVLGHLTHTRTLSR
jgi:hypothetical protein